MMDQKIDSNPASTALQISTPTVSFLMPVYNAEDTLAASLDSALKQTHSAEEIVVIDDGSRDGSAAVIAAVSDPRIRAFSQANQGLAATLNRGIALATSQYIARLDNDDLALPQRLERQLAFMEANPQVALLGTWSQIYVEDTPSDRFHRHPTESNSLKLELLFDNPFVHSSVMYRTDIVRALGGYRVERQTRIPEDYEFWSRIARVYEVANLPEVHTIYREMPNSMTRVSADEILDNVLAISSDNLQHVLPDASQETCKSLARLYHGRSATAGSRMGLEALWLWRQAAIAIGGPVRHWTSEFRSRYRRTQRRLFIQVMRQSLPVPAANLLRSARRRLRPNC